MGRLSRLCGVLIGAICAWLPRVVNCFSPLVITEATAQFQGKDRGAYGVPYTQANPRRQPPPRHLAP